jgi:hypothetical protein
MPLCGLLVYFGNLLVGTRGGLAGQPRRMGSAEAMEDCELMRIQKDTMMLALHREHELSDRFVGVSIGPEHPVRSGFG